jgi:uncharacterized membrane protein
MNAIPRGALVRRKPVQRLIGMIILLCCIVGLFAATPLFQNHSSIAHAAGSVQINAGGPAVAPFVADMDFTGGTRSGTCNSITT